MRPWIGRSRRGAPVGRTGARVTVVALAAIACGVLARASDRIAFSDVASDSGLTLLDVSGSATKDYIIDTLGHGAALFDYDNDGDLDALIVNGSTLARMRTGGDPMVALYRNDGTGRFTDVTSTSGFTRRGWANGVCVADIDNDGFEDVYVTAIGPNVAWRNTGTGRFEEIKGAAGSEYSTGCAFVDFDRDGFVDLYVANFLVFDEKTTPRRGSGCTFLTIQVMCGPRPLPGQVDALYRNEGGRGFRDVSRQAGIAGADPDYYGLGVVVSDIDDDGWPDIYVANDSVPNLLFRNNQDGTFVEDGLAAGVALTATGRPQAGMGVDAGDYDQDGDFDFVVTNFSQDYTTLYRNEGGGVFTDASRDSGTAATMGPYLGWGVDFADFDHDGLLDLFIANGHVFPNVDGAGAGTTYLQRNQLFRNAGKGRLLHVTDDVGGALLIEQSSRGSATGDIDNDGDLDVLVVNIDARPTLLRNDRSTGGHWVMFRLVGTKSNRSAIGARLRLTAGGQRQTEEVRGGGSYLSHNDLRVHFGLGGAQRVDRLEIRWPSGLVETLTDLAVDRVHVITEGGGKPGARAGGR